MHVRTHRPRRRLGNQQQADAAFELLPNDDGGFVPEVSVLQAPASVTPAPQGEVLPPQPAATAGGAPNQYTPDFPVRYEPLPPPVPLVATIGPNGQPIITHAPTLPNGTPTGLPNTSPAPGAPAAEPQGLWKALPAWGWGLIALGAWALLAKGDE